MKWKEESRSDAQLLLSDSISAVCETAVFVTANDCKTESITGNLMLDHGPQIKLLKLLNF